MDISVVYDTLLDNIRVASVVCQNEKTYMSVTYRCFISCELSVEGKMIPVYVGIPDEWEQKLVDIYIEDYRLFPYIPHVDTNGKLCLFELEGVLIDSDLCGLLNQCIGRAIMILTDGLNKSNEEDFIREFSSYWDHLPESRIVKFAVPFEHMTQDIKYVERTVSRRKKESFAAYQKRSKSTQIFAAADSDSFSTWNITGTQKNGVYFFIHLEDYIYPPDARKPLNLSFINTLLRFATSSECRRAILKTGEDKAFIFQIEQPNGISNYFGVLLRKALIIENESFYQVKQTETLKCIPLSVHRIDKTYLMNRTNDQARPGAKKCLMIGCGSIGGYLCNELVKNGFENITLVDKDVLQEENIFRHFLGIEYVGQYKAEALVQYFKKNIPHLNLKAVDGNVRDLIVDGSIALTEYDLIISAMGNHNINRWLNKVVHTQNVDATVFYVWNEPLDIGCHVAVIQSTRAGCYECFFKRNEQTQELYDATAYCNPGQNITKNFTGCSGSFVPYGSTVSLKSSTLCMEWVSRMLDGRCNDNVLISFKGGSYYFKKAGLMVSNVFVNQSNDLEIKIGSQFQDNSCEVCG